MVRSSRRGAALLEVLAAVAILGIVGIAYVGLMSVATQTAADVRARDAESSDQDRLLTAYTLLTRGDLTQRLGRRRVGQYVMDVQRPDPSLFRISVGRLATSSEADLVTIVFRPESINGP